MSECRGRGREGRRVGPERAEREGTSERDVCSAPLERGSRGAETNSIASGRGGSGDGRGLISTAVARSSPFAAATAIRRARGRSQEADRPPGIERDKGRRRRKIRTSESDSRRSACFYLCLREPRSPVTRTRTTSNLAWGDRREFSTPSRARIFKRARNEGARADGKAAFRASHRFFFGTANSRKSMLSVPKRAFCSFSECEKREYPECGGGLECLRKGESASSGGTEKNATRQSINSNCFPMLARLRTLKTLAPIASSSRASEHVFLPVSVLCTRAYREAWKLLGDSRRRTRRGARNEAKSDARISRLDCPCGGVGARERENSTQPSTTSRSAHPPTPRALFLRASVCSHPARGDYRQSVVRVPREKEKRERVYSPGKLRRRKKKREKVEGGRDCELQWRPKIEFFFSFLSCSSSTFEIPVRCFLSLFSLLSLSSPSLSSLSCLSLAFNQTFVPRFFFPQRNQARRKGPLSLPLSLSLSSFFPSSLLAPPLRQPAGGEEVEQSLFFCNGRDRKGEGDPRSSGLHTAAFLFASAPAAFSAVRRCCPPPWRGGFRS